MKPIYLLLPLVLGGCAQLFAPSADRLRADLDATCEGAANCRFVNSPVRVDRSQERRIASRKVPFYPTLAQLDFVDGSGATWVAPEGIVTDGASIPPIFVPIVGDPTSPEFVNAAAVHDAYCGIGNERGVMFQAAPWEKVHVMFYDALLVGGVSEIKAKVMFAAVWLGGPRWGGAAFDPAEQPRVPMQKAMQDTKEYIEEFNPAITELIEYLSDRERGIMAAAARVGATGGAGNAGTAPGRDEGDNDGDGTPDGEGTAGEGTDGEGTGGTTGDDPAGTPGSGPTGPNTPAGDPTAPGGGVDSAGDGI